MSDVTHFPTGAIRDIQDGKESYVETISWTAFRRYAEYMTGKKKKYGSGNFKKGIPPESYEESLVRHLVKYMSNTHEFGGLEEKEDHLSAMVFNIFGLMHEEARQIENGLGYNQALDDILKALSDSSEGEEMAYVSGAHKVLSIQEDEVQYPSIQEKEKAQKRIQEETCSVPNCDCMEEDKRILQEENRCHLCLKYHDPENCPYFPRTEPNWEAMAGEYRVGFKNGVPVAAERVPPRTEVSEGSKLNEVYPDLWPEK